MQWFKNIYFQSHGGAKVPAGKVLGGKVLGGKRPGGKRPGAKDRGAKDRGGERLGGKSPRTAFLVDMLGVSKIGLFIQ